MSAEVQKAAINEALELSHMFRQNAALKHGLPECKKQQITNLDEPKPQAPPVVNITNQLPAAPAATDPPSPGATAAAAVKGSLLRRAAPWLLTTALAGGGAGALTAWLTGDEKPAEQPAAAEGDLLQELQRNGFHLPERTQWQTE